MKHLDRRSFLALSASAAAAAAVASCSSKSKPSARSSTATSRRSTPKGLGNPKDAPFEHVVLLMMENRSFDHLLGWVPGADAKQAGLKYPDLTGTLHPTWDLGADYQSCNFKGPAQIGRAHV